MLLKFGYVGTKFYGYQRQPHLVTVEGEIIRVLKDFKLANAVKSASRTDRGVSALGNVVFLESDEKPEKVIGILNANLKYIYFHSYAERNVNPRFARQRWYRYHLPDFGYDLDSFREAALIFTGEHDFYNFTRMHSNTRIKIDEISVMRNGNCFMIDFRAQYYLWNVIRRIVAAMTAYATGKKFGEEVFDKYENFGIAPPEPLILMDVSYDFEFTPSLIKYRVREKMFRQFASGLVYRYLAEEQFDNA